MRPTPASLPIDSALDRIVALASHGNLVVTAPPGSGKTTHVPVALRGAVEGSIVVLEPRRIAARMAAARVAWEQGVALGSDVGYQVRFERRMSQNTRVLFVTEGVLARRLLDDPDLRGVGAVVLDEFHERHLHGDLALAWLRHLQFTRRPDLRLVVMSATLAAEPLAAYLDGPVVAAAGRQHPVEIEYEDVPADRPLDAHVAAALRRSLDRERVGDVLVFLPGAAEIRRSMAACAGVAALHQAECVALHGDMPLEDQQAAVSPGPRRKVIFSTNVAESSITVEGVTVVIDSGLSRLASTSPWSGLNEIRVEKISRASADQRAGRAGRVRPGRCVRLYPRHDYERRREHEVAELHRVDLSEVVLLLCGAGMPDVQRLPWYEAPVSSAVAQAALLLERLGALQPETGITAVGRQMLALAVHPRLGRLVVASAARGIARLGCTAAALLSERDIRISARVPLRERRREGGAHSAGPSDVLAMIESYEAGTEIDASVARRVRRLAAQLARSAPAPSAPDPPSAEQALLRAVLIAWPDRVARRRVRDGRTELLLSGGGTARLADTSVVHGAEWLVCVDAEDRAGDALVRVASEIDPAWLLDDFIERIGETSERVWNEKSSRVEMVARIVYDRLVLDETRRPAPRDPHTARILWEAARKEGTAAFADPQSIAAFLHRAAFVRRAFPEAAFPPIGEDDVQGAFADLCACAASFSELRDRAASGLVAALENRLTPEHRRLLERAAPQYVSLPTRRRIAVHYEAEQAPWIASRLQDFFGMREGPRVAEGRVPLVLHLLAPNQRPVQVTTDLAGFWVRHYPQIRRELARRYPRHAWPETPA